MKLLENIRVRAGLGVVAIAILLSGGYYALGSFAKAASHDIKSVVFDKDTYPAVVLGGGIGGMTASVYLSLANMQTYVVEGDTPGGLLTQSLSVRNWPGVIESTGEAISSNLRAQAIKCGATFGRELATSVNFNTWPYEITVADVNDDTQTRTIKALTVVIAMGAASRYLKVPGEQEYWSKGVANCAVCEGSLYRDKTVCVVGGGDSAMEEASYLASIAKKVYVFVRRGTLRAVDKRKDELGHAKNVEFVYNTSLSEIHGDGAKVTHVTAKNNKDGSTKKYDMDGVFLAIGFTPNTKMFKNFIQLDSGGYITLTSGQETSLSGVYAVGDIEDPIYKQAVTAAGEGCRAALQAHRLLQEIGYKPEMFRSKGAEKSASQLEEKEQPEAKKPTVTQKPQAKESSNTGDAGANLHEVTSVEQLDKLLASKRPVVIDYYATWCLPCKRVAPLFKELSKKHTKIDFVKVNIDDARELAQRAGVQGVPTFTFHKAGEEVSRSIGALSKREFERRIAKIN